MLIKYRLVSSSLSAAPPASSPSTRVSLTSLLARIGRYANHFSVSEIMTNEPYNFSTTATGLMFLSALVGSIFGYFTGVFADTIVVFFARRNGGVKEPEMRLWTLCISFIYAGVGYLLYGWAADAGLPWIAIAIGLGAMIAHQVSACSIATAYAMDCFPGVSSVLLLKFHTIALLTTSNRYPGKSSLSSPSALRVSTSLSRSLCSISSMPLALGRSLLSTESWSC
jgi:hypothetical protein